MRVLRTAVLTALLVIAGAAPVSAAIYPPAVLAYTWLICDDSEGELLEIVPGTGNRYDLVHTIAPCAPPQLGDAYAIVFFRADGTAWGRPFVYPQVPATLAAGWPAIGPDNVAVCLLTTWAHYVDCAEIVVDSTGGAALGSELTIDAPAVALPVLVEWATAQPACPSCAWGRW